VTLVPALGVYPSVTVAMIGMRGALGVLQFASGWMLIRNSGPGRPPAYLSLLASAALITLELGFDLAPSNLFHTYHWPVVIAYWIYALTAAVLLKIATGRSDVRS
jgi:hypothetical protein